MGTSGSSEQGGTWTAGAFIYSGRRDPEWELTQEQGTELARALALLPPIEGPVPVAPPLGYRGAWLRGPGAAEWQLYGGTAVSVSPGRLEHRMDARREIESRVLATAPAGLLPPGLPGQTRSSS
jgi:hypothetical protein